MEIDREEGRREVIQVAAEHGMGIWFDLGTVDRDFEVQVGVRNPVLDVYDFAGFVDAEGLRSMSFDDFRAILERMKLEWLFK